MNVRRSERPYKNERLDYIANQLRVRPDISPAELARELHISERTVYRDIKFLEQKQIPSRQHGRRKGRYPLDTELTLPPLSLAASEAYALYRAAAAPALTTRSFLSSDLGSALGKLGTALTSLPDSETERDLTGVDLLAERLQQPTMALIRQAIRTHSRLRIRYWPAEGEQEGEWSVSPYDLRRQNGHWVLLAHSEELGGIRGLKLHRLRALEILPERFRFPRRFSADACFTQIRETASAGDSEVIVRVRFVPAIASLVAEHCKHQFLLMEIQADGSLIGEIVVGSTQEILWWILAYGNRAEVLSPPELREDLTRITLSMAALYVSPR